MGADLLTRMGREIDHVELVKVEAPPTADKISRLCAVAGDALVLFGGQNGHFLLEELGRGAVGTMPGSDMADAFVAVWNAYEAGDVPAARKRFLTMLPLIRYELQPGHGVAVMKQNLFDAGIIASPRVRHPATRLEATEIPEIRGLRADLALLAFHHRTNVAGAIAVSNDTRASIASGTSLSEDQRVSRDSLSDKPYDFGLVC